MIAYWPLLSGACFGEYLSRFSSVLCFLHSFFEFSLCLSRACLGKMIVFIYKWRKKWAFNLLTWTERIISTIASCRLALDDQPVGPVLTQRIESLCPWSYN
eukprot:COSAG06_NODE_4273_length_4410_cov_5.289754_6_plen_101_part_00